MTSNQKTEVTKVTRLAEYQPPAFLVDTVDLDFDIRTRLTYVSTRFTVHRNPAHADELAPLTLDGENQTLKKVTVNGIKLTAQNYELTDKHLILSGIPDEAVIEIESTNEPSKNTTLSGLYAAGPMLCTQCESQGFRRITYYPDRPDVLAKFRVKVTADKKKYPKLLSNGNLVKKGREGTNRHYVIWEDPFAKPAYLFALVAGKMDVKRDKFVTKSGRDVLLEIYVEPGRKKETGFAMAALKNSMKWDEKRYGLEYDLDRFMIVAVSFFNMGAMENKGLNIFNDSCVLGLPETATDGDIDFFERVVGHEYFHNYTGNRVTCRDWFQLTLKEGLTVFREQEFCGDMRTPAFERLHAVSAMRRGQFPEDAGAMAHPIRPASYQSIDNFYTATVYNKGSEVIRMIQTLVGKKGFRKGLRSYLKTHDGSAATCEDFVLSMADANDIDLDQFMNWYGQAGTPVLDASSEYNAKAKEFVLHVRQTCPATPGQKKKKPFYMPLNVGFLDSKGKDMKGTFMLDLVAPEETFVFLAMDEEPIPSLNREFSAPVVVNYPYTDEELQIIMANDKDGFNRWDAAQKLFTKYVLEECEVTDSLIASLRKVLKTKSLDDGTRAMTLALPSEAELGLSQLARGKKIDPIKLYEGRQRVIRAIAEGLSDDLWALYEKLEGELSEKASDFKARGQRSLKNLCLAYLAKVEPETVTPLAAGAIAGSRNLTDKVSSLAILVDGKGKLKDQMLDVFAQKFKDHPSIMDNWLACQASARRSDVLCSVKKLMKHKTFDINNPNRVGSLFGAFARNPIGFHAEDGSGYRFIADMAAKVDKINPQAGARLAKTFLRWKDYNPKRRKLMKEALEKLAAKRGLSANVKEIVTKALGKK